MHNSKLILLLKSLTKKEFNQLDKFLRSPFLNSNKQVIRLYNYFNENQHFPEFKSDQLSKQQVDHKLFSQPNNDYTFDPKRIRDLMSNFSVLVEEFLIVLESLDKQTMTKEQLLLKSLSKRNLYKTFKSKTKSDLLKLEKRTVKDDEYYKQLFDLNFQYFFHPDTLKQKPASEEINAVLKSLDQYYVLNKLKISCELLSRQDIFSEEYNTDFFEEMIHIAKNQCSNNNQLFLIYSGLVKLFSSGFNSDSYQKIKSLYFDNLEVISEKEQRIILHYLINIISSAINKNKGNTSEIFSLYQQGLKNKILIHNNRLTPATYSNIAILGSKLKEFKWTLKFIADYEQYLAPEVMNETKSMSLAYWYFNKSDFDKALSLIIDFKMPSDLFNIRSKALLVRTLMEKFLTDSDYYNLLDSKTEALRKQVERSEIISKRKKEAYNNFLKYTRRITTISRNQPKNIQTKLDKLFNEIQIMNTLVAKDWLLEKVNHLLKNKR